MLGNLFRQFFAGRTHRTPPDTRAGGDPQDPSAQHWRTEALRWQQPGRHAAVAELTRSVLEREPGNVDALQLAGAALLALGETRDGLAFLRRAAELTPESADLQATLADVLA